MLFDMEDSWGRGSVTWKTVAGDWVGDIEDSGERREATGKIRI